MSLRSNGSGHSTRERRKLKPYVEREWRNKQTSVWSSPCFVRLDQVGGEAVRGVHLEPLHRSFLVESQMNIFYVIGVIVVVLAVLAFLGLR